MNRVTTLPATNAIDDIEIVATVVQLARATDPEIRQTKARAKAILKEASLMYPGIEPVRIRKACGTAADLLLKQHSN